MSESFVRIKSKLDENSLFLFERKNEALSGTIWANGVNRVDNDGDLYVSVINCTPEKIKLKRCALVG